MILPQKHITLTESMFGFGGILLGLIKDTISVDDLWVKYTYANDAGLTKHTFDRYILALDYLFMIGAIVQDDRGCILRATD